VVCEAALEEFVACAMERMRVYARTVPVMREIVVIVRMWLRQRTVLNAASSPPI
jgi:DNA polymerase sigma